MGKNHFNAIGKFFKRPHTRDRKSERGNIFFTLFGAVAVVGLLGTGIMSTMKGPLSTMVEINRIEEAKSQMRVNARLILTDPQEIDTDTLQEPLEPAACTIGVGGAGCLPASIGATLSDPWGNDYAYCAWNLGADTSAVGRVLEGDVNSNFYTIAVISAGPDLTFSSNCSAAPPAVSEGGDDIVVPLTYEQALASSGGLWTIDTSDPNELETPRNIEVGGSATFGGALNLSGSALPAGAAASLLLPTQAELGTCNAANDKLLRVNTTVSPHRLEICDNGTGFVSAGSLWVADGSNNISYAAGDVAITGTNDLSVGGTTTLTGALTANGGATTTTLNATGAVDLDTTLNVDGNTTLVGTLGVTGATTLSDTLGVTGATTLSDTLGVTGATTLSSTLGVTDATTLSSTLVTTGLGTFNNGITVNGGTTDINNNTDISGTLGVTGATTLSSTLGVTGNATFDNPVQVNNTLTATGDITTTGTGIIRSAGTVYINGSEDLDPQTCAAGDRIYWDGDSWECQQAVPGGSGTGNTLILNDLTDVDTSGANSYYDCLVYSGGTWVKDRCVPDDVEDIDTITFDSGDGTADRIILPGGNGSTQTITTAGAGAGTGASIAITAGTGVTGGNTIINGGDGTTTDGNVLLSTGYGAVGIGTTAITSGLLLDVEGSVGAVEYCDETGNGCIDIGDLGSTIGVFELAGTTVRNRGDDAVEDFVFGSDQLADVGNAAQDSRFFFDKSAAAFRAGSADATQWDTVGNASIGLGANTIATGANSVAIGLGASATDASSIALGNGASATNEWSFAVGGEQGATSSGANSIAIGDFAEALNDNAISIGSENTSSGSAALSIGAQNTATNTNATAIGFNNTASGLFAMTYGDRTTASGNNSLTLGQEVRATGINTVAVGMADQSNVDGTRPQVSGMGSFGIFMDTADNYNLASTDQLGIIGGQLMIDTDAISTDRGCIRYNDGADELEFSDDCITYTAFDDAGGGSRVFEVTGGAGSEVVRQVEVNAPIATSDFVFGSSALDNIAGTDDDNRVFFDKSQAAFRAGYAPSGEWNNGNVGLYSFAGGNRNIASGINSTSFGGANVSSGISSFTVGSYNTAGGNFSNALGAEVQATSNYTFAIGLSDQTGGATGVATQPTVSGQGSFGIFMDTADNYNLSSADQLGIIGGELMIDTDANPADQGCIRYNDGNDQLEYSDDCTTYTALADAGGNSRVFEVTGAPGSEVVAQVEANAPVTTSDFVFGSPQLDDLGNPIHDSRFFFDKSKGAFRAGIDGGDFWDEANVGGSSFATGNNPTASGFVSFASGQTTVASGNYAIAMGYEATASGSTSLSIGTSTTASATNSIALGREVQATGTRTVALGLADQTGAFPIVSGEGSFGILMDDAPGYNLTSTDQLGIIGGELMIDGDADATNTGCIRYDDTSNQIEFSHDCATYDTITGAGDALWQNDGPGGPGEIYYNADNVGIGTNDPVYPLDVVGNARISGTTYTNTIRSFSGDLTLHEGWKQIVLTNWAGIPRLQSSESLSIRADGNLQLDGDNSISFRTNNALRWVVDNSGHFEPYSGTNNLDIGASTKTARNVYASALTNPAAILSVGDAAQGVNLLGNVGIGTATPAAALDVAGTNSILFPRGTAAQRPAAPVNGMMRYNSDNGKFEAYQAGSWQDILTNAVGNEVALHRITVATADNAIDNAANNQVWNWELTAAETGMTFGESAVSTGGGAADQHILAAKTLATSTAIPLYVENLGDGNSFRVADGAADATPFVIDDTGRVGIGANSPNAKVEIFGTTTAENAFRVVQNNAVNASVAHISAESGAFATSALFLRNRGTGGILRGANNGGDVFEINNSGGGYFTGDIGIGTNDPKFPLDVGGGTASSDQYIRVGASNAKSGIIFTETSNDPIKYGFTLQHNNVTNTFEIINHNNDTTGALAMSITRSGGNVRFENDVAIGDFSSDTIESAFHIQSGDIRLDGGAANEAGCIRYDDTADELQFSDDCTTFAAFSDFTNPALDDILAADGDNTIASGANNQVWNWELAAAETGFTFGESAASAGGSDDQHILAAKTLATSTAMPLYVENAGAGDSFRVADVAADTTPFVIDAAGRVGIGTDAPNAKFQVRASNYPNASIRIEDIAAAGNFSQATVGIGMSFPTYSSGAKVGSIYGSNSGQFVIEGSNGLGSLRFTNTTNVLASGLTLMSGGSLTRPSVSLSGASGNETGFYLPATNQIGFITDRTERMRLDASGNLGIGNFTFDTVESALHVRDGAIRIDGGAANEAGCIRFDDTVDELQFSDDCSTFNAFSDFTTTALDDILAADGDNTIASGANNQVWNWELAAAETGFTFGESAASTGGSNDQHILAAKTLATSTAMPLYVENAGAGDSFRVDDVVADTTPFVINAAGRVGIGTDTPIQALHVQGSIAVPWDAGGSGNGKIGISNSTGAGFLSTLSQNSGITILQNVESSGLNGFDFRSNSASLMRILRSGNVGIGTTSPEQGGEQPLKLDIEGAAGASYYCDGAGNNCFVAGDVSAASVFQVTGASGSELVRQNAAINPPSTADFVFGSPQLADDGNTDHDNRMFFDKSKGAFRAGRAIGTEWDDANVGNQSVAFGTLSTASGNNTLSLGIRSVASGSSSLAIGQDAQATGFSSIAIGENAIATSTRSTAIGFFARSTGSNSVALGDGSVASGPGSTAMGYNTVASDFYATAMGRATTASGQQSTSIGSGTTASGNAATAMGSGTTASGITSTAMGSGTTASGITSTAMGREVIAGSGTAGDNYGDSAFAIGLQTHLQATDPVITGDRSMVLFFDGGVPDANSAYDFTESDKFALIGGEFQIDSDSSTAAKGCIRFDDTDDELEFSDDCATYASISDIAAGSGLWQNDGPGGPGEIYYSADNVGIGTNDPSSSLHVHSSSGIGFSHPNRTDKVGYLRPLNQYMTELTDVWDQSAAIRIEPNSIKLRLASSDKVTIVTEGVGINTTSPTQDGDQPLKLDVNGAAGASYYCDGAGNNCFVASDVNAASVFEVTGASGSELVRQNATINPPSTADFVFGSSQINDTGTGTEDNRFFFDKSAGAFRAGSTAGSQWDTGSLGDYSAAFGFDTTASGNMSTAIGSTTTASGFRSFAGGFQTTASGDTSTAIGLNNTASGAVATALGQEVEASGTRSMAIGLQSGGQTTDPVVSGNRSLGIFMDGGTADRNSGIDMTANDTFAIVGGDFIVGSYQTNDTTDTNHDSRMFFDRSKYAFRAGRTGTTEWDDASIGTGSVAFGQSSVASGNNSFAFGTGANATGNSSIAGGSNITSSGVGSIAMGVTSTASADQAIAFGNNTTASGIGSLAMGFYNTASGIGSIALGDEVKAAGAVNTMVIGLSDQTNIDADRPQVSGSGSLGIFMDQADNYDLSSTDQLAIIGGELMIDGDADATNTGCIRYNDTDNELEFSDDCTSYASISDIAAGSGLWQNDGPGGPGEIYYSADNVGIGTNNPSQKLDIYNATDSQIRIATSDAAGAIRALSLERSTGGGELHFNEDTRLSVGLALNTTNGAYPMSFQINSDTKMHIETSGNVGIGDFTSDTAESQLHIQTGDIRIDGGAANEAGCIRFDDTADELQFSDDCSTYTSFASFTSPFEVTGASGSELVRQNATINPPSSADFVFGSSQLNDSGAATEDNRFFFDKGQGAFRAGTAQGTQWDSGSLGIGSAALGYNITAAGNASFATGISSSSGGYASVALGNSANAGGSQSVAIGSYITASGADSFALGHEVNAAGTNYTAAFGLADQTGAFPIVSGSGSLGIFMDDAPAYDLSSTDQLGIIGGELMIDGDADATNTGCIRYNDTDNELEFSDDCTTYSSITDLATSNSLWQNDGPGGPGEIYYSADNVGIGTNDPDQLFHIAKSDASNPVTLKVQDLAGLTDAEAVLHLSTSNDFTDDAIGVKLFADRTDTDSVGSTDLQIRTSNGTSSTTKMIIKHDGDVAIGTSTPIEKFHVQGKAYIREGVMPELGNYAWGFGRHNGGPSIYGGAYGSGNNRYLTLRGSGGVKLHITNHSGSRIFTLDGDSGDLGLGNFSADTVESALHLQSGDIRIDGGAANEAGCIRFDDTTDELQFSDDCSTYTAFSESSSPFEVTGAPGSELVRQNATINPPSSADFVFGSTQLADTGNSDHDNRMFFDKSKSAFRVGQASSTQWNDSNIGSGSFSSGFSNIGSGTGSFSFGSGNRATADYAFVGGIQSRAAGNNSFAYGHRVQANNNYTVAFGLATQNAVDTQVTGQGSFGIFMDDTSSYNLSSTDQLGIIGGELMIDGDADATNTGCIRYNDTDNELEFSDDCATYASISDIASSTSLWQNDGAGGPTEIYYNADNVGIGTNDPDVPLDVIGDTEITGDLTVGSARPTGIASANPIGSFIGSNWGVIGSTSDTDALRKYMRWGSGHYTNSEEPLAMMISDSISAASASLRIGGGTSLGNTFTDLHFYTAPNSTTVSGTVAGGFNRSQQFILGPSWAGDESSMFKTIVQDPSWTGQEIQLAASQTGNAWEIRDSSDTVLSAFDENGNLGIGTNPLSKLHIDTGAAANTGLRIDMAASQTANPFEVQNSGGSTLFEVDELGNISAGAVNPSPFTGTSRGMFVGGANNARIVLDGVKQWNITSTSGGSFSYRNETDNVNAFEIRANGRMGLGMGSTFSSMSNITRWNVNDQSSPGTKLSSFAVSNLGTAHLNTETGIDFKLMDSGSVLPGDIMAQQRVGITDLTDGASDGTWTLNTRINDVLTARIHAKDTGVDLYGDLLVTGSSTTCTLGNGSGSTNCTSDERLKTNIVKIDSALDKIAQLNGVTFNWKDETKAQDTQIGVIAQNVEAVFPEVVGELNDEQKTKTVDYAALVAPLIEATKELKAENEALRAELSNTQNDIKALKAHTNLDTTEGNMTTLAFLLGLLSMGLLSSLIVIIRQKRH